MQNISPVPILLPLHLKRGEEAEGEWPLTPPLTLTCRVGIPTVNFLFSEAKLCNFYQGVECPVWVPVSFNVIHSSFLLEF